MIRSIRWRIQLWHAAILLAVVAGFGSFFYARLRQARFREIDTELAGVGQSLVLVLSSLPPHELERSGPLLQEPPPPELAWLEQAAAGWTPRYQPPPPPPPRDQMERMDRILDLPASFVEQHTRPHDPPPYFVVWRRSGEILKASADVPAAALTAANISESELADQPYFSNVGGLHEVLLVGPSGTRVAVGRSIRPDLNELNYWARQLVFAGGMLLLLGLAGGAWVSHGAVQSIRAMSTTAAAVSEKNLAQRMPTARLDSELAPLAATLNRTWARLEAAFDRQARFTADASHELRTPLAILLGHLELALHDAPVESEQRETLLACQRAGRRMKALVEGLLFLARVDAGEVKLQEQTFDLAEVCDECLELLAPLAQEHNVTLAAKLEESLVGGDPRLLAQVITNLVSNAIRYNRPGGSVQVTLSARDEVLLTVADTGLGIAAADRAHLFERFFRLDRARSRTTGGVGLGLAITQQIVSVHQGELTFSSEVDTGSTFHVHLPRARSDARLDEPEAFRASPGDPSRAAASAAIAPA